MHSLERPPQENKKIWWLVGSLAVMFILISVWLAWPNHSEKQTQIEGEKLIKENSETIISASFKNSLMPEISSQDYLWGNQDAKLSLVVYEDLSQSFSADLDQSLEKLKKDYGNDLKIAYRSFPASGSFGLKAAQNFRCAFAQGKGWEFRQEILSIVKERSLLEEDFYLIAKKLELNQEKFKSCLGDQKVTNDLIEQTKEAAQYGVIGSPTLFIGDEMINGARPLADFTDSSNDKIEGLETIIQRKLK